MTTKYVVSLPLDGYKEKRVSLITPLVLTSSSPTSRKIFKRKILISSTVSVVTFPLPANKTVGVGASYLNIAIM